MFHVEHRVQWTRLETAKDYMSKISKERPRLGRGLSSLMSVSPPPMAEVGSIDTPPETVNSVTEISSVILAETNAAINVSVSRISVNPHQPRRSFSEESLQALASSLKSTGMIQPIVVRAIDGGYQLIAGERRWRAAKLAGFETVQIIVRDVDGYTQAQMALVENIQRENLNPIDRASAYQVLMKQLGVTQAELANRLGEERSSIANHLRLLDLEPTVQSWVIDGNISLGHAKILASISDPNEQSRIAGLCVEQGLSVRNLERLLTNQTEAVKPPATPSVSPHVLDVEKSVARQLGMRVQLKQQGGKGKGRLVIHYASLDQFDELLQRLNIKLD